MPAKIIDGRAVASELRAEVHARADALRGQGVSPCLAISLVGEDEATAAYVRSLERSGQSVGVEVRTDRLAAQANEAVLRDRLLALGTDASVHGIILAQPLPLHLRIAQIADAIVVHKDVDGTSPLSLALLAGNTEGFVPATPAAILALLERTAAWPLRGKRAAVIGRSRVVGLPAALLLLRHDATVTILHSKTRDLARSLREAEIVVAAAGVPGLVRGEMLAPDATVIDAGTTLREGRLVGDVDYATASEVAGAITPVPGGVGPVTNVMLMRNVVTAAERRLPGR